jgi:hypothetical protein
MANEHSRSVMSSAGIQQELSASVTENPDGGWITRVELGDGASLSKWFDDQTDARSYADELAAWLATRASR